MCGWVGTAQGCYFPKHTWAWFLSHMVNLDSCAWLECIKTVTVQVNCFCRLLKSLKKIRFKNSFRFQFLPQVFITRVKTNSEFTCTPNPWYLMATSGHLLTTSWIGPSHLTFRLLTLEFRFLILGIVSAFLAHLQYLAFQLDYCRHSRNIGNLQFQLLLKIYLQGLVLWLINILLILIWQ
jgi:hypothetical protein